ncbi:MAG: Long-chain-fatty-acid-CoA ligase [Pseudomonadota bacterium]|jgi:fatty-acyl-CoA synthase
MNASPPKFWTKRLPFHLTLPAHSLWTNLEITARRYPAKAALRFFGNVFTYQRLLDDTVALAGYLQQQCGVKRGDRVLLFMQNCPQFITAYYAILRADAVVVPVNPMNKADEFAHYITDTGAGTVVCSADLLPVVEAANAACGQPVKHLITTQYADALPEVPVPDDAPPPAMQAMFEGTGALPAHVMHMASAINAHLAPSPHLAGPDDLAVMPYTSGTTGFPKGCMHTHATVMHNVIGGAVGGGISADATVFSILPMFHVTGMMYGMHVPIYTGATVVMIPRWDREVAGNAISKYKITHWTNIPTMIIDMLASPNVSKWDLSSLAYIGGGGAAMPEAVAQKLKDQFGLQFIEGYGLSETIAPTHSNPTDRPKLQCLGIPVFGTQAYVVNPDTLEELPPGEVGEIIVRGPQVFKGYWGKPEATKAAFVQFRGEQFFRTGDLGRTDGDGYFFLTDRLKRMINASGFKVWPAEVEALLYKHPDIAEACIIGAPDEYRGETVKAVVVLRDHAKGRVGESAIIDWARAHMAAYKVPRRVQFVGSLPKSGSGKVMWRALQEQEWAGK